LQKGSQADSGDSELVLFTDSARVYLVDLNNGRDPVLILRLNVSVCLFISDIREMSDGLNHLQSILSTLPHAVIVVMRYLFAFLNQYVHSVQF